MIGVRYLQLDLLLVLEKGGGIYLPTASYAFPSKCWHSLVTIIRDGEKERGAKGRLLSRRDNERYSCLARVKVSRNIRVTRGAHAAIKTLDTYCIHIGLGVVFDKRKIF